MTKLGALILTPAGFAMGGFIGAAVGEAFAGVPVTYGEIRPITKREQEAALAGGTIGALLGATLVAVLGAGPSTPPQAGVSSHLAGAFHNPEFP